ncbi:bacterial Ig-like domain (group 1) [Methanobrevibacter thaueri]|uniref:Bacterial Ig-like domain (Group 1) n=1 Tax=Methanobrevibacter thaueri TaxID=190975 RepID=A0A315XPJ5_9EURY|nr:bacterial Ig-like domain (group 1) [Methanobrevibacter thaueri]
MPSDATGNLTVSINGKNYTQELVNGSAIVNIPELNPGNYNAIVTYSGDSKYNPISVNASVSIPKPVLTAKNFSMLYTSGAKYTVRVTLDGKAVTGKKVSFTINGKKTTATTDKNGYASVKITLPPKSKAYTVTATYLGVKVTNKVTVKSILVAKNMKVKKSAKKLTIKVTLKKVNKKYLKGKTLTLKFKGKTYKAKTNSKGVATFSINKNVLKKLKVGKKYSYKVTHGKDVVNKKITVKK